MAVPDTISKKIGIATVRRPITGRGISGRAAKPTIAALSRKAGLIAITDASAGATVGFIRRRVHARAVASGLSGWAATYAGHTGRPVGQTVVHVPQCCSSVCRSTHPSAHRRRSAPDRSMCHPRRLHRSGRPDRNWQPVGQEHTCTSSDRNRANNTLYQTCSSCHRCGTYEQRYRWLLAEPRFQPAHPRQVP